MKKILLLSPINVDLLARDRIAVSLAARLNRDPDAPTYKIIHSSDAWEQAKQQTNGQFRNWPAYCVGLGPDGRFRFDAFAVTDTLLGRGTYDVVAEALVQERIILFPSGEGVALSWRKLEPQQLERASGDYKAWGVIRG